MKLKILLLCLLPLSVTAQDLNGIWTGYLQTPESRLHFEIAISESAKKINGYSLIIYRDGGVENTGIKKIKLKKRNKEIFIEDGELVYDNFTTPPKHVKLLGTLFFARKNSMQILSGSFQTRSLDFRDASTYKGEIYLQKQIETASTKLFAKLDELHLLHTLSFIPVKEKEPEKTASLIRDSLAIVSVNNKIFDSVKVAENKPIPGGIISSVEAPAPRETEVLQSVFFTSDSLVLSLFDNGTIDGDTVSVILNGKVIISKGGLTSTAIRVTVPITAVPGDSLLLVMYAENLGAIPPNTGLLIIQDGTVQHEIRFEGDLKKSAGIILRKKR